MYTQIINNCLQNALNDEHVAKSIQKREESGKARIKTIHSTIRKSKTKGGTLALLIRIGFDFILKEDNNEIKEDLLVDIIYKKGPSGTESYRVGKPIAMPEILDLEN